MAGQMAEQLGVEVEEGLQHLGLAMEAFATGFSVPGKTQPGHGLQTERFKIVFQGVTADGEKNMVTRALETCYDWTDVMKKVLGATRSYGCLEDIEDKCEEEVRDWLATFNGWGLLHSLLPLPRYRHFLMALLYTSHNWVEATGGPKTELKVFNTVKYVYEHIQGKSLGSLVPRLGVWFEEDEELQERRKRLVVMIRAQWTVAATFVVEKKRLNRNLKEFAAEAVARCLWEEEDLLELEVPVSLRPMVRDKYRDVEWVRGHWMEDTILDIDDDSEEEEGSYDVTDVTDFSQDFYEEPRRTGGEERESLHWAIYSAVLLLAALCF